MLMKPSFRNILIKLFEAKIFLRHYKLSRFRR
jgi:hypothetical protein